MRLVLLVVITLVALLAGCTNQQSTGQIGGKMDTENRYAVFETSNGEFTVELYEQRAPETTENFITLANKGFYDGTRFHRVIADFMIQGGDPLSKDESKKRVWGTGGPGYTIEDEFHPDLQHDTQGILSMANSGPDTGGSQFFITVTPTPWLDGKHAVFGKVVENYELVEQISNIPTNARDQPIESVIVERIQITDER